MTTHRIPTNLRAMLILEAIGTHSEPLSAAEIGRAVGLPKQTVHRLCNTLTEEGFLIRTPDGGLVPGRRLRLMCAGALHASGTHIARHQILQSLAVETGETVNFVVPEQQGMSYKDRVETDWPFRVQLPIGSHVPFHCTASGKTYLASLRRARREQMVKALTLKPLTPNTFADPANLMQELSRIARQGFALDNEEFIEGMAAIAVPVKDDQGRYMASLGVHGPVQRFSTVQAESIAPLVTRAADRLSKVLCNPEAAA